MVQTLEQLMAKYKKNLSKKTNFHENLAFYIGKNKPRSTKVRIHIYDAKTYKMIEGFDTTVIKKALAARKNVWVDIVGLADNVEISRLCVELGIHILVVEDILHTGQRPKIDVFNDYLFIVLKLLDIPKPNLRYTTEQFSILIKKHLLLTFRETNIHNLTGLYQRLSDEKSFIRTHACDFLTYLVMDNIVDDYFDFIDETTNRLEKLEDLLINKPEKLSLKELYAIKRQTLTLRKTLAPIRDVIHLILREHKQFIDKKYHIYYRDLYDHSIRLLETANLHHDMIAGMLDLHLSTMNNHMNESIKVLTLFASLFIPLSFITSVYGMNFKYMPELEWHYGYPGLLIFMLFLVIAMLYYFKRKKLF